MVPRCICCLFWQWDLVSAVGAELQLLTVLVVLNAHPKLPVFKKHAREAYNQMHFICC